MRIQESSFICSSNIFSFSILLLLSSPILSSQTSKDQPTQSSQSHYTYTAENKDGIGKIYMGREISHVMGHQGIAWLERDSREKEELPNKVVEAMELKNTDVVADIGAGSGYFTFRIAPKVPNGKVLAVDIQPEMLETLKTQTKKRQLGNVETVLGTITNPNLKPNSVDVVLFVDAYHEFSHPREMMEAIVKALKPGGRVIQIEYRGEDPDVPIKRLHKMTQAQAKKEMIAVGLEWVETKDFLPRQHFMVFRKMPQQ